MLEPREADIPALFLVLVVLPLVIYILLGKWNEVAKKNARISMLAQLAAEEALRVEAMATADVIPVGPSLRTGVHQCARCLGPATTRCSRCKSVRYCSGKCQIIHWRQGHKEECQRWENSNSNNYGSPSSMLEYANQRASIDENMEAPLMANDIKELMHNNIPSDTSDDSSSAVTFQDSALERKLFGRKVSHKFKGEILRSEVNGCSSEETDSCGATTPTLNPGTSFTELSSKGTLRRPKAGHDNCTASDEIHRKHNPSSLISVNATTSSRSSMHPSHKLTGQGTSVFEACTSTGSSASRISDKIVKKSCETELECTSGKDGVPGGVFSSISETLDLRCSTERIIVMEGTKFKRPPYTLEPSNCLPQTKALKENLNTGIERKACTKKESDIPRVSAPTTNHGQSNDGIPNMEHYKKMASSRKLPKLPKQNIVGIMGDNLKKNKMLFPYEDLVEFFQCEVHDISPRGLLNCGNSCYANAVLQCLTCTKPLMIYLLRRMHSRTCSVRDWCLMCELELHVSMLRESGGSLSPSRILTNMRNIGCRIGGGNQEDAHEFLRLLVMSMQSICLEELDGEKEVDLRLQETTLIQQIFGGRLKSKVKCLRCHLESERYESIMDLTLEIHGWVESLEDALTQFTAPEELDGENMYRCGRCSAYVRARKQLSVHEAPNILTIVLKRFQTGKYGKINKCVTFPDMLDMIPFMTGSGDSPPLYLLYAVVVHVDTLNASFSGHYVSYVKDLQGEWFRIDDSEVQPVALSQVMSEGAYMLFYSRSFPRPPRMYLGKTSPVQAPTPAKHAAHKTQKSSRHVASDMGTDLRAETSGCINGGTFDYMLRHTSRDSVTPKEAFATSVSMDFSDATSSDWSLFTSSDESSFTTESTSDSFSTVDYGDAATLDPISSIFSPSYIPEHPQNSKLSCTKFSCCRPQTRFFSESKGFVLDSSMPAQLLGSVHMGRNPGQVSVSVTQPLAPVSNCSMSAMFVRYGSRPKDSLVQTSGCCD